MLSVMHEQNCKNFLPITDVATGEVACANCGSVLVEKDVDVASEQIWFSKEEKELNSRVGKKLTLKLADMGLSTFIEKSNKDSTGKSLSLENTRIFHRLRLWDKHSRYKSEHQSFNKAFITLDAIKSKLGLPEVVVEKSAYLFRKTASKNFLSGRSTIGILCAIVYLSCRLTNTPRTLQDVANAGNVKRKSLQRVYRFLTRELEVNPDAFNPMDFVERISKSIGCGYKTRRDSLKLMEIVQNLGIGTSKNPMAVAAAVVHLSVIKNKEKIRQIRISEVSGISAVTIRDRAKDIRKKLGGEI